MRRRSIRRERGTTKYSLMRRAISPPLTFYMQFRCGIRLKSDNIEDAREAAADHLLKNVLGIANPPNYVRERVKDFIIPFMVI